MNARCNVLSYLRRRSHERSFEAYRDLTPSSSTFEKKIRLLSRREVIVCEPSQREREDEGLLQ